MTQGLTTQQADLLDLLRSSERTPSYAEMASALGLSSRSRVAALIEGLEARGFIERIPHRSRAVRVLPQPKNWSDGGLSGISTRMLVAELSRRGVQVSA